MDVFDLAAKISLDSSEYDKGLSDASDKTSGFGTKIKGFFGGAAKVGAAALAAASGAAIAMAKNAVSSYASYEQLVGGVDKLYKDASGKLQGYADKAFLTAGMSANQYMETATSFSASLINSLGGDTQKAADLTDVAMRAMSDNVNVFGSSMESVQFAFQGFAKQNYTMLDNLKLGYGGTKEEMQRLIDDANKYRKSIGQSSNLSIKKFGDIVQAIQSVQEAQGIAGTTNKEAMRTIEGAANATKAAWQNVITAIGRGEGLKGAMDGLATALFGKDEGEGLLAQVIPRIQTTMEGIAEFLTSAAPIISKKLPEIANAVIPSVLSTAVSIIEALGGALPGLIGSLAASITKVGIDVGNQLINSISTVLNDMFPTLGKGFDSIVSVARVSVEKVKSVWNANSGQILAKASEVWNGILSLVGNVVSTIVSYWNAHSTEILETASEIWDNVKSIITTTIETVSAVVSGVVDFIKTLWNEWGDETIAIYHQVFEMFASEIELIRTAFETVVTALSDFWSQWGDTITSVASTVWGAVLATISTILSVIQGIIAAVTAAIQGDWSGAWNAVLGVASTIWGAITSVVSAAISAVSSVISSILNSIKATFSNVWSAIKSVVTAAINAVSSVISSVLNRISAIFSNVWNAIKSTVTNAINGVKSAISSGISAAYSTVSSILSNIKSKFTSVFESVKSTVTNAINTIKGAFNFSWSLPPIRLPHISVSGSFSLNPPSVPSFGISWYKKAMDNAYMLNGATIFGSMGGKLLGGGETGKEILIGESRAIDLIRKASGDREPVNVTINVYARENQDVNALADVISRKLQKQLDRRSAVYA